MKFLKTPAAAYLMLTLCCVALVARVEVARAQVSSQSQPEGLRLKIECEEPTGILLDRDTIATKRSALFSIHVFNQTGKDRMVKMRWRIEDSSGRTLQKGDEKYDLNAGNFNSRRELFLPPGRGGFVLIADANSKADGPDFDAHLEFPFAVIAAPEAKTRQRPLVLLDAPLRLSEDDFTFYSRLGVSGLRTQLAASDLSSPGIDSARDIDAALDARERHGFSTVGVLEAPKRRAAHGPLSRDDENWLQFALQMLTRFPSIRTWEVVGATQPDTIAELARAAHNMNPPRGLLASPPEVFVPGAHGMGGIDGALFSLKDNPSLHPASLRRALLFARSRAEKMGAQSWHVRDESRAQNGDRLQLASELTTHTALSLATGAEGMSASLALPGKEHRSGKMARAAAFAAISKMLGRAEFQSELYPSSPVVLGSLFKREDGGSVAILWTGSGPSGKVEKGRLNLWQDDLRVYDLYGNDITKSSRKEALIPLGPDPVFVESKAAPEALARALHEAQDDGLDPLAAQVLPFGHPIEYSGFGKPKGDKFALGDKMALRVRLQNIGLHPMTGTLGINPPPSWKLVADKQQFNLDPGQSRIYDFEVSQVKPNDKYPVVIDATAVSQVAGKSVKGHWGWTQETRVATARNVVAGESIVLDGALDDWKNADWMHLEDQRAKVDARLAVKWDSAYLFFAAKVKEPRLTPRNAEDDEYSFWEGSDAIQLAFGLRDAAWMQPGQVPFRDTDFGFLLSPFHVNPDNTIDARVLRLWNQQIPFANVADRVRWGGAVPGARCVIRRDERQGETYYEAAIPLSEMPDLNPALRSATKGNFDSPVRFSWQLHADETRQPLQWSKATDVFDWWGNPGSFLPPSNISLAAQTTLGFAQIGEVASGLTTPTPSQNIPPSAITPGPTLPPAIAPLPPRPIAPEEDIPPYIPAPKIPTKAPPKTNPTPKPSNPPSGLPRPVPVEPIPPGMLPPAPPPG